MFLPVKKSVYLNFCFVGLVVIWFYGRVYTPVATYFIWGKYFWQDFRNWMWVGEGFVKERIPGFGVEAERIVIKTGLYWIGFELVAFLAALWLLNVFWWTVILKIAWDKFYRNKGFVSEYEGENKKLG